MTDIGTALEKLIEVLQIEGHELFEVFVAAQTAIGIAHIIIAFVTVFGAILGGYCIWKYINRIDFGDEVDRVGISCIMAIVVGIILLFVSLTIYSGYMHIYYPEYTAAKELMERLGYMM